MQKAFMKTRSSLLIAIVSSASLFAAISIAQDQKVSENPSVPSAKNAGRVLQLKEIWRITDDGGQFYFKHPYGLEIAPDGRIFLKDEAQLLRFGPDGKFKKNLYKEGQGPGEISKNFSYCLDGDLLLIRDWGNRRFFRMNAEGVYQNSLDREIGQSSPLGARPDGYIVMESDWPLEKERTGKLLPLLEHISLVSRDGKAKRRIHTFQCRWFMTQSVCSQWDADLTALGDDGRFLVGCHASKYLIEILDIDAGQIIRSFSRKYSSIKHEVTIPEKGLAARSGIPPSEYEWDVQDLFADGKAIWVKTSTSDPAKGDLYDVFDYDGRYVDSFYLGPGRSLMKIRGNDLYSLEKDAKDNFFIVKYRLN